MGYSRIFAGIAGAGLLLGCALGGSVQSIAIADNQAIARARDEVLVQNILRATAREPLLFTAISQVQTSFGGNVGLGNVFSNIIAGGRNAVSNSLNLSGSSGPIVTVAPLANKDFTNGVLRPLGADTYGFLVDQGWDADFLLPLIVASVRCPGTGKLILNSGKVEDTEAARLREALRLSAPNVVVTPEPAAAARSFRLTIANDKAADILQKGLGAGYAIGAVTVDEEKRTTTLEVSSVPERKAVISRLDLSGVCGQAAAGGDRFGVVESTQAAPTRGTAGSITFRSVEGIIYFLGETFRPCYLAGSGDCAMRLGGQTLFSLRIGRPGGGPSAVATTFHDRNYWMPAHNAADPGDRTLKTLSLLALLISLQVEPSSLSATPAVLSISR